MDTLPPSIRAIPEGSIYAFGLCALLKGALPTSTMVLKVNLFLTTTTTKCKVNDIGTAFVRSVKPDDYTGSGVVGVAG